MLKESFEILQQMHDEVLKQNNLYLHFKKDSNWKDQEVSYLENEGHIIYVGKSKYLLSERGYKVAQELNDNKKKVKHKADK